MLEALFILGVVVNLVGGILLLVAAFKESVLWGLGCLFLPIVPLIFTVTHWSQARVAFLVSGSGFVMLGLAVLGGRETFGQSSDDLGGDLEQAVAEINEDLPQLTESGMEWTSVTLDRQVVVVHVRLAGVQAGKVPHDVFEGLEANIIELTCESTALTDLIEDGIETRTKVTGTLGGMIRTKYVTGTDCELW